MIPAIPQSTGRFMSPYNLETETFCEKNAGKVALMIKSIARQLSKLHVNPLELGSELSTELQRRLPDLESLDPLYKRDIVLAIVRSINIFQSERSRLQAP